MHNDNVSEIARLTEIKIAAVLEEVEGIHATTNETDPSGDEEDDDEEKEYKDENRVIDWVEFDR